ncbi:MAG: hypothetical protein IIX15_00340 [Clostridia bacterium]|nr:hypothetical protein [Clostridia bacterium]
MKTEVKNTKRFWRRGNVLDIVILLLVIAAVASVVLRYYQTQNSIEQQNSKTVYLSFAVEEAIPGIADAVLAGDTLYLADGTVMGTLVAHERATGACPLAVDAAQMLLKDASGRYVNATLSGNSLVDLEGVLRCTGIYDEQGAFLLGGRYSISPGQKIAVLSEKTAFVLYVTAIDSVR